jgi:hypothetical protein
MIDRTVFVPEFECPSCGSLFGGRHAGAQCCGVAIVVLSPDRRYDAWRAMEKAALEHEQRQAIERLFSCWSCGCVPGEMCPDHYGPLREGERRAFQGGKSTKNPAGASLRAMRAVWDAFPREAQEIIASLRWHGLDVMWSFLRWDHFVGIETDGEIHS